MRPRTVVAGAAVLALLALGAAERVRRRDRAPLPGSPDDASARDAATPSSAPPARRVALPRASARVGDVAGEPSSARATAPALEDLDPSWRESRVVSRLRTVGPVAHYVDAGLRSARAELAHCFQERPASTNGVDAAASPAVLVLYLEERAGAVDVVDARVDRPGVTSPDVLECSREVLRGYEIPAPNAVPGRRYRLPFQLE